jgi:hypothetical protein
MKIDMETRRQSRSANVLARVLSILLAGLGAYGLKMLFLAVAVNARQGTLVDALYFGTALDAIFLLISSWWLYAAWLGWHHRSARSVRWLCAASVFVFEFFVLARIKLLPGAAGLPQSLNQLVEIPAALVAAGLYILLTRYLVSRLGLADERSRSQRKRAVERWLGLLIFLLWWSGFSAALEFAPRAYGTADLRPAQWFLFALFGSVLASTLIYKSGVRLFAPKFA